MAKIIEKVAAVVHYVDGRTEEGYFRLPVRATGYPGEFATLMKEDDVHVFINLSHVINIDQKIIFREGDDNHGLKVEDFATKRCFLKG